MAMPLAGVYGVENEEVVKDLVRASDLPYSYVHRTLNTLDGMDFALLYYADRFFTERIETGYGYLCVEGTLDGKPTAVLLTRGDRYAAELLEELRERTPGIRILCAGKLPSGTAGKTLAQGCIGSGRAPRAGQCLRTGRLVAARPNPDRHGANRHPGRCFCPARPARSPQRNAPADLSATTLYGWHRPIFSNTFYILNKLFLIIRKIIVSLPLRKRRFFHRCLPNGRPRPQPGGNNSETAHLLGKTLL